MKEYPLLLNYNYANPLGTVKVYEDNTCELCFNARILDIRKIPGNFQAIDDKQGNVIAFTYNTNQ